MMLIQLVLSKLEYFWLTLLSLGFNRISPVLSNQSGAILLGEVVVTDTTHLVREITHLVRDITKRMSGSCGFITAYRQMPLSRSTINLLKTHQMCQVQLMLVKIQLRRVLI